jgi:hypothetical protein
MDDAAMAAVTLDDGGSVAGVRAATAAVRLALRRRFPPDS